MMVTGDGMVIGDGTVAMMVIGAVMVAMGIINIHPCTGSLNYTANISCFDKMK